MSATTATRPFHNPVERRTRLQMSAPSNISLPSARTPPSYGYESSGTGLKKSSTLACMQAQAATAQPGPKRRPSRAGTRSVSTLTTAQLERKRANDREAQRAIRQRTKDHIEGLERRVAELMAREQAGGRVTEIMQRNDELEQENVLLRSRLSQALAALGQAGYHEGNAGLTTSESNILTASGAPSPADGMHMMNQPRPSSTPTSRSAPSVAGASVPPPPVASHTDHWRPSHAHPHAHPAYSPVSTTTTTAAVAAGADPAAPLDGAAPPDSLRWSPHGQHVDSSPVPVAESALQPVENAVPHSLAYGGYVLDANGRAVQPQYEPPGQQMAYTHIPVSNTPAHAPSYPHHDQRHLPVQVPNPSPYQHYPHPPPQAYMSSSHHAESMIQRSPMDGQHMMYSVSSDVNKPEQ